MTSYDVVVIGGGAAGTSCLFHLAERGITRTLLLEQDAVASGSSGRSAAFIETQYVDRDKVRLTVYGERLLEQLAVNHGLPFVQRGKLLLARGPEQLASYRESLEFQHGLGHRDTALLETAEISSITPLLDLEGIAGALYGPRDGYTDPVLLCRLLADLAEDRGAAVRHAAATGIVVDRGKVSGVRADGETIGCGAVVNAAGAWARGVGALGGVEIPVDGFVREILVLEDSGAGDAGQLPLVVEPIGHDGEAVYFRGDGGRLILAGFHSHRLDDERAPDPRRYRQLPSAAVQDRIALGLARRYRGGERLLVRGGWTGLYPLPADGLPILGESARVPGFWSLAGLAGNGIQLAPGAGAVVADLIAAGTTSLLPDVDRYGPDRFF